MDMATAQLHTLMRHIKGLAAGRQRTDRQLLDDFAARRDEGAFAALLSRHGAMVLRVCRRVLRHEQDAEDAFQATFLVLARHTASIRQRDTLAGWLYGVAYRTAMEAKRKAGRRRKHEAKLRDWTPSAAPSPVWDDVQAVLDEEVQRLPEAFRSAFVLCVLEGKTVPAAAAELRVNGGTLSWRLARARQQLRRRLAARGIQLSAVLAALAVASGAGEAAVPVALASSTVRFGLSVAAGGPAAAIPSHVAALAAGVTGAMFVNKAKLATAVVFAVGLIVATGAFGYQAFAQKPEPVAKGEAMQGPAAKSPAAGAKDQPADKVEISGRVLDPDGKPLAGAKLFVPRPLTDEPLSAKDIEMKKVGETDAEGRFRLTLKRPEQQMREYLIAHAAGFGVDWIELGEGDGRLDDVSFRLVKDVPIAGRVLNTEGRPIAGVSVSVGSILVPSDEKLDDYMAGWLRDLQQNIGKSRKQLYVPLDGITGPATTDKEGRFTLHGAGGERVVSVAFYGSGVAQSSPYVVTRTGFDAERFSGALRGNQHNREFMELNPFPGVYGLPLTFVGEPGKSIEGVVKDADSGKPLSACRVFARTTWGDGVGALTDAAGKFRLDSLPKNPRGYDLSVLPPAGGAYLSREAHAADTDGYTKVALDIDLVKGAVVTGRVVDRQTGQGVTCNIRFAPLPDNKFFGSRPGFDNYRRDRTSEETDKGGRFRLATIPGKALVLAQVSEGEKLHGQHLCVYRRAVPDPDHKDLFKPSEGSWTVSTAGGMEFLSYQGAVKVIDVKEEGETQVELSVDRGATARIAVQDADGKPLAGAWAAGLADLWPVAYELPEATATVYALDPSKPRAMAFFHAGKKLGGTAVVRGDEKEPVAVKLAPLGQVAGRLLDTDGNPLDGVEVSINPTEDTGSGLYRSAKPSGKPVRTDKDGRFRVEGVVPGLKFWLGLRRDQTYFVGEPRIGTKQVKPGEALDLGDVRVKPAQ
jgi:RNA polymerase sigma factor (sigma-70 family)